MNKSFNKYWLFAAALAMFSACSDDDHDDNGVKEPTKTVGAYILNTGNWGAGDASICYMDANGTVGTDMYAAANNGDALGDLGQDLIIYGSKLYCTVSGSNKVVVMNKKCKKLYELPTPANPRYMAAANGSVFVTCYSGQVYRLDTLSQSIKDSVAVGAYPEAIAATSGRLFVNNSGYGSGNTVSVVDIATMTNVRDIEVELNPYTQCKTGADGNVYMVSNGNYAGKTGLDPNEYAYATLQRIDPATFKVTKLGNASYIACASFGNYKNKIYATYGEYYCSKLDADHQPKSYVYDLTTGKTTDFVDVSGFTNWGAPNVNGLEVDPISGDVYVITANYGEKGVITSYTSTGTLKSNFSSNGSYPSKMVFDME